MITEKDAILIVENNEIDKLVANADIIFTDGEFGSVVNMVVALGTERQLEELHRAGYDLSRVYKNCYTLLETAVLYGRFDMVCALLRPEYNAHKNRYEMAYAAAVGRCDMISHMSQCGIDACGVDESGRNGLHWAAQENDCEICELLLKLNCCTNQLDCSGQTPLYVAAAEGNLGIVKLLIEAGAHVDLCGYADGTTPFSIACHCHNYKECDVLLHGGADIDSQDSEGYTALMGAVIREDEELIKYLLARGADTRMSNSKGISVKDYMMNSNLRKEEADVLDG